MRRLIQKLGLHRYRNVGPLRPELMPADKVGIRLKQHVGAPCEACVAAGQPVRLGEVVGKPPIKDGKSALGAPVHASIDGVVTAVEAGVVWIEKKG
jgi:Na+-translocating ferredoxin:NAD+ oxidoreductase RnfC subunit